MAAIMAAIIVTADSSCQAVLDLKSIGAPPTLRGIKDKLGGGSLSTIQARRQEIMAELPEIPPEIEAKLGPYINAGAELVQVAMREANASQMERVKTLQQDFETISKELKESEVENAELKTRIEELEEELIKRDARVKLDLEMSESLKMDFERTKTELIKKLIREDDYQKAKAEACEAKEKAAKLEGRLEEMERTLAKQEAERPIKEPGVKKNKARRALRTIRMRLVQALLTISTDPAATSGARPFFIEAL